jgi:hypothetical protein
MVCHKILVVDVDKLLENNGQVLWEIKNIYPQIAQLFHFRKSHHVHLVGALVAETELREAGNDVYAQAGQPFPISANDMKKLRPSDIEFLNSHILHHCSSEVSFARDDKVRSGWKVSGPIYGICARFQWQRDTLNHLCIRVLNTEFGLGLVANVPSPLLRCPPRCQAPYGGCGPATQRCHSTALANMGEALQNMMPLRVNTMPARCCGTLAQSTDSEDAPLVATLSQFQPPKMHQTDQWEVEVAKLMGCSDLPHTRQCYPPASSGLVATAPPASDFIGGVDVIVVDLLHTLTSEPNLVLQAKRAPVHFAEELRRAVSASATGARATPEMYIANTHDALLPHVGDATCTTAVDGSICVLVLSLPQGQGALVSAALKDATACLQHTQDLKNLWTPAVVFHLLKQRHCVGVLSMTTVTSDRGDVITAATIMGLPHALEAFSRGVQAASSSGSSVV